MSIHVEYQMGMFGVKAPRDNRFKFISGYDAVFNSCMQCGTAKS